MKKLGLSGSSLILGSILMTSFLSALAIDPHLIISQQKMPPKSKLDLYLLIGQSNMAGRGRLGAEDKTPHPRVLVFTLSNTWKLAVEPITKDRKSGLGVGPGLAFGKAMAEKNQTVNIGLIPCAVGGTPLARWEKGGDLYSNAVQRAKLAMHDGTLKGILWHQGESDSGTEAKANGYSDRLLKMIGDIRTELASPRVPFVVGELGEFLYDRGPDKTPYAKNLNAGLAKIPPAVPFTALVSSHGLTANADHLHFDAASQREFGRRYAEAISQLESVH
jgi:hypothetical protein